MKKIVIAVSVFLLTYGCATQSKTTGPNLDVAWSAPDMPSEQVPLRITTLGSTPSNATDGSVRLGVAHSLQTIGDATGLGEVFALSEGQDIQVPAENEASNSKKKEGDGSRKVNKEDINTLGLMAGDLGIAAAEQNDMDTAARSLDLALLIMTSFSRLNDESAKKAASLWGSESLKDFKGEPHERAVVFLWRGLVHIAQGDLQNARACFMSANLEDQFAKDMTQRGNWFIADLLERQCSLWLGDGLETSVTDRMTQTYPSVTIPETTKDQTVLLVCALGYPPLKTASGHHGSLLAYERLKSDASSAVILPPGAPSPTQLMWAEDVVMQAATRGPREMDEHLAKEAKKKDQLKKTGDVMEMLGGFLPYGDILQYGGQAVRGASAKAKAFADTRSLHCLSSELAVGLYRPSDLPEGSTIQILDTSGNAVASAALPVITDGSKPTVIIVRYAGRPGAPERISVAASTPEASAPQETESK